MKTIDPRKAIMTLGGILIATLAAGCFGGGPGYWNSPYGYNSSQQLRKLLSLPRRRPARRRNSRSR